VKLTSPSTVMELLREKGIRPKRGLDQHFLCDANILAKTVAAAELSPDELVIEPGAGLGTLTLALAARAGRVIAVELDPRLISILQANITVGRVGNVQIVVQDFLKLDLAELVAAAGEKRAKVVGNLPYGITSPGLERLMAEREALSAAVLMVQSELAERLTAPPGPRANVLGVQLQALAEVKLLFRVPRTVFLPSPEVDSAVIRLSFLKRPRFAADERVFTQVVRAAFNLRRKTIGQALIHSPLLRLPEERAVQALQEAGICSRRRGESLSITEFDRLAQAIQGDQHS
jgi:16S rRNA (adenine1518-N6/adenine1519-N6)-dimethyltransferase